MANIADGYSAFVLVATGAICLRLTHPATAAYKCRRNPTAGWAGGNPSGRAD
jgi:hypothetical protein